MYVLLLYTLHYITELCVNEMSTGHTGVVNLISDTVRADLHLSHEEWGVAVGIFCVGGLLGASCISQFADKIGRKKALTLNSVNFILTGALQFVSGAIQQHHHVAFGILLLSRIIAGVGCGAATVVVPMYLGEIANKNLRGAFGSLNQFAVVVGLFISQLISTGLGSSSTWKWLLSISGFLGLLQMSLGCVLLESPKWLATKNRLDKAKQTLLHFRDYSEDDADAELDEIMLTAGKCKYHFIYILIS
jgi:MFS family permease